MIDKGAAVVRVSQRNDEGKLGDRGTVRGVINDPEGKPAGYHVEWEKPDRHIAFVAPVRIQLAVDYEKSQTQ